MNGGRCAVTAVSVEGGFEAVSIENIETSELMNKLYSTGCSLYLFEVHRRKYSRTYKTGRIIREGESVEPIGVLNFA
jgi:hypothetical protein